MPDDNQVQVLPVIDSDPKGEFIDPEDLFYTVTDEEIEAGNRLGSTIDIEDDLDAEGRDVT